MTDRDYQHSRILDVHRWSEHQEANLFVDEVYDTFPVLHQMRSRRGGDLSGGQQQQLAISHMVLQGPFEVSSFKSWQDIRVK